MMEDLISRQAAIDALGKTFVESGIEKIHWTGVKAMLEYLPSAQPERTKGKWYHGEAYPHHLYCSVCYCTALPNDEFVERWNLHMNFCPNCGADMRGENDELR